MCECTAVSLQRVGIQAIAITVAVAVAVAVTIFTIRHVVSPRMIVYFLRGTYPFIPDRAMSRPYDQGPLIRLHVAAQWATISRHFGDTCSASSDCNNIVHFIVCFRGAKLNWYVWKWPFNQLPCEDLRKTVVENSEISVLSLS